MACCSGVVNLALWAVDEFAIETVYCVGSSALALSFPSFGKHFPEWIALKSDSSVFF